MDAAETDFIFLVLLAIDFIGLGRRASLIALSG
jgi:hypothetical protein